MTRFKKLRRIEAAIRSEDASELDQAAAYCRHRIAIAPTASHQRYWRKRLAQVERQPERGPDDPYACGLKPGDKVELIRDLVIEANPRIVHRAGEIWDVLPGSCSAADDVWLRRPDGAPHTWSDTPAIYKWFRKTNESPVR